MEPTQRARARAASIAATSLIALALAVVPARAQNAEADQKFAEAERLLAAGKVEEACAAFEESNRIESGAGTLINLGLCREKLGKLASALAAYQGALARVKDPKKKAIAKERVTALEPRVSRVTIAIAPAARVSGLAVTRGGEPVDAADWGEAIPVDGGRYEIAASAPGHRSWSTTIRVAEEGGEETVEVPALAVKKARREEQDERGGDGGESAPAPASGDQRSFRPALKVAGFGLVGVSVASAVYVLYVTIAGPERDYEQLKTFPKDSMGMPVGATIEDCGREELRSGADPANRAFDKACTANVRRYQLSLVGLVAGVAGGVTLYFAYRGGGGAPGKQAAAGARRRRELAVMPHIGPHGGGASLSFTW